MKKIVLVLFVVLSAVTGFAQQGVDLTKPQPVPKSGAAYTQKDANVDSLREKTDPILAAAKLFPEEKQMEVILSLADAIGVYSFVADDGECVVLFEDFELFDRLESSKVRSKANLVCDISYCSYTWNSTIQMCSTYCDIGNFVQLCTGTNMMACCGCIDTNPILGITIGCGVCRWFAQ